MVLISKDQMMKITNKTKFNENDECYDPGDDYYEGWNNAIDSIEEKMLYLNEVEFTKDSINLKIQGLKTTVKMEGNKRKEEVISKIMELL